MRASVRLKMLLVISVVLLAAMGTYLYLATSLFSRDKLAYIYDLNASMVASLTEQTRSSLEVLRDGLVIMTGDVLSPRLNKRGKSAAADKFFSQRDDVLMVEIYGRDKKSGELTRQHRFVNAGGLEQTSLGASELVSLRKLHPLAVEAIAANPGGLVLQNSSLQPDAPILTLAFAAQEGESLLVVAADFRHDRLLHIFGGSKMHETYLVDENGIVLAHPDGKLVIEHADLAQQGLVKKALDSKVKQGVLEFAAGGGATMLGAYSQVGVGRLSVLSQIPKEEALRASRDLIKRSAVFGLAILLVAFIVSIIFSRLLTAPIRRLSAATQVLAKGDFDVNIDVASRDEIGDLARDFKRMASSLQQVQSQLIQSEKLAAFGQLGAGITHEVKNPMTGIVGFAQIGRRKATDAAKSEQLFGMIEKEAVRCTEILVNFLKFARSEERSATPLDINGVVREASKIFSHHLSMNAVKVELDLAEDTPQVLGNAQELQQVLLNLAMNAMHAMQANKGGLFKIETRPTEDGGAVIKAIDNGPGIPDDVRQKVFEPFFTTKKSGDGTGLGLAVTFGIIRDHKGVISVESTVGEGATFVITLPPIDAAPPVIQGSANGQVTNGGSPTPSAS